MRAIALRIAASTSDAVVGPSDASILLLDYGPCPGCASDLDGNGEVDGGDLSFLLLLFE